MNTSAPRKTTAAPSLREERPTGAASKPSDGGASGRALQAPARADASAESTASGTPSGDSLSKDQRVPARPLTSRVSSTPRRPSARGTAGGSRAGLAALIARRQREMRADPLLAQDTGDGTVVLQGAFGIAGEAGKLKTYGLGPCVGVAMHGVGASGAPVGLLAHLDSSTHVEEALSAMQAAMADAGVRSVTVQLAGGNDCGRELRESVLKALAGARGVTLREPNKRLFGGSSDTRSVVFSVADGRLRLLHGEVAAERQVVHEGQQTLATTSARCARPM